MASRHWTPAPSPTTYDSFALENMAMVEHRGMITTFTALKRVGGLGLV